MINVNQKPFILTGLNPSSTYQISVRDSCGPASLSTFQGPVNATTDCAPSAAPYMEDFDGSNFILSTNVFLPGTFDTCWDKLTNSRYQWNVEQGQTNLFGTGPDKDHTSGNGKYLLTQEMSFGIQQNVSTWLETELIDVNPLNTPQLRFWYHMFGVDIDSLNIEVFEGGQWHFVHSLVGQQQNASSDPWKEASVNLDSFANKVFKLRFTGVRKSINGDDVHLAIDDLEIREKPSCPKPSNFAVGIITENNIQISWTTGGANNWQVRYRQAGTAQAFTTLTTSSNPFTVTGLTPATIYEFFVRDSCAPGDVSLWVGPLQVATTCNAFQAPWYENFDGSTWTPGSGFDNTGNKIDPCWSRPDSVGAHFGVRSGPTGSSATGPASDFSGSGKYLYTEASGVGQNQTGEITTPYIYLPFGVSNMQLKFAYHMFGSNISSLTVMANNGNGFNTIKNIIGPQHMSDIEPWKLDSVSLSAYAGDTVQFKFLGSNTGFRGDIAIDEVSVSGCDTVSSEFTHSSQNLQVSFNSSATVNADSLFWDFGDGNTDTAAMPVHSYLSPGSYSVSLYGYNSCSVDTFTVNIDVCDSLMAGFHYLVSGDSVHLFADSSTNASGFHWDLDDGKSSMDSIVGVKYDSLGLKQVSLMTYNSCGDTAFSTQLIKVCDSLNAGFQYQVFGDSVLFYADSSTNAAGFLWDLDEGKSSTDSTLIVKYDSLGTKQITLTTYNLCGDTARTTQIVEICPAPEAVWTYSILSPINSGLRVQFDASASSNAAKFIWDFGDGIIDSSGPKPIHVYSTPGLHYNVTLTVKNECDISDVFQSTLQAMVSLEERGFSDRIYVYPNPVKGHLNVDWHKSGQKVHLIRVYDLSGKEVDNLKVDKKMSKKEKLELSTGSWTEGIHILAIETKTDIYTFKIQVRK